MSRRLVPRPWRCTILAPILGLALLMAAPPGAARQDRVEATGIDVEIVQLVDNGDFEEAVPAEALGAFWLTAVGRGQPAIPTHLVTQAHAGSGRHALRLTSARERVYQYIPAFEELADRMTVRGSVYLASAPDGTASATLTIRDSQRREVVYVFGAQPRVPESDSDTLYIPVPMPGDAWSGFTVHYGGDYLTHFGRNPAPRVTLELGKQDAGASPVYWDDLQAMVSFPAISEAELLDKILAESRWIIDNLLERTIDDIGTPTPYLIKSLDAITGEVLSVKLSGGGGPVYNQMLAQLEVRHDAAYYDRLVAIADATVAGISPTTGLPRKYDGEADACVEGKVIPAPTVNFLLRVHALTGDANYLDAATRIGEAILDLAPRLGTTVRTQGTLPRSYIPNSFHSETGDPIPPQSVYEMHIRWFASPGALIHLYVETGRMEFHDAAMAAALDYVDHDTILHYWGEDYVLEPFSFEPTWYDWDHIDPAFDDYFGYGIGGRGGPHAILDFYELVGDERLLPFLDDSLDFMRGVWDEGIHRGGYTFADDARSWQAYYDRYVADPVKYAAHKEILIRNARNVFRSSQYINGAWIDARFRLWSPSFPDDRASCPRNLLAALSWAYLVDDRDPAWRAMIAAVFDTTVQTYKREYGYLLSPDGEQPGANPGGFELRFVGEILHHLVPHLTRD